MCDDIFDDLESDAVVLEKSWVKNVGDLSKAGYREGVDAGKEESVQLGFNEAFAVAAKLLFQVARLRGNISGRLSAHLLKPGSLTDQTETQLQDLLQNVCLLESDLLNFSEKTYTHIKQVTVHSLQPSKESDTDNAKEQLESASHAPDLHKTDVDDRSTENIKIADENITEQSVNKGTCINESQDDSKSLKGKTEAETIVGDQVEPQKSVLSEGRCNVRTDDLKSCDNIVRQYKQKVTTTEPLLKRLQELNEQYMVICDAL